MIVEVTQSDIDSSIRKCMQNCMAASALKRHLAPNVKVFVTERSIGIGYYEPGQGPMHVVAPSEELVARIRLFDRGAKVVPFSFYIEDIPQEYRRKSELFDLEDRLNVFIPEVIVFDEGAIA